MKSILKIGFVLLPFFAFGQGKVIVKEPFDYPDGPLPASWWSEGCTAEIKDGRLFVDADTVSYKMSTIWLDKEFGGDFSITFDVHVVSSQNNANNINCMLLYSDPAIAGRPLRETRDERKEGIYKYYHELNGYIFTHLANGDETNARFRFRDNPGFNLLEEQVGYECFQGKTYHVKIIKTGDRFQYYVDGNKMIDKVYDGCNPVYNKGLFGFRAWRTALWWDNLVIKKPPPTPPKGESKDGSSLPQLRKGDQKAQ